MATRLEELAERLAALEAETVGYAPYGEEYAPYEEEYAPYEEEYAPYEEETVGALEEVFEGMSEDEIGAFSDTLEALETGQIQLEDLTPEEMGWFSRIFKKVRRFFGRVRRSPVWKIGRRVFRRFAGFEEEMAAKRGLGWPRPVSCRCPPGYRTVPVTGYRCVRARPWPVRPPYRAVRPPGLPRPPAPRK